MYRGKMQKTKADYKRLYPAGKSRLGTRGLLALQFPGRENEAVVIGMHRLPPPSRESIKQRFGRLDAGADSLVFAPSSKSRWTNV